MKNQNLFVLLPLVLWTFLIAWCDNQVIEENSQEVEEISYSCSSDESDQTSCALPEIEEDSTDEVDIQTLTENATNIIDKIWGLDPEVALEYMQVTDDLIIIDTRDTTEYPNWFEWSLRIPWNQIADRVWEIPEWSKVLLHCGWGNVAPKAYRALLEANPRLESLAYIDGTPLFDEYNEMVK